MPTESGARRFVEGKGCEAPEECALEKMTAGRLARFAPRQIGEGLEGDARSGILRAGAVPGAWRERRARRAYATAFVVDLVS